MHSTTLDSLSGSFGFVIRPDAKTIDKSYSLAKELLDTEAEYILAPSYLPHITLYHSRFSKLAPRWVKEVRDELNELLVGIDLELSEFMCFGEKFIFWNVSKQSPSLSILNTAHLKSLELADYLDPNAPRRSEEEGIELSDKEKENSLRYNHPLVEDLYTPHITLGYSSKAASLVNEQSSLSWTMQVSKVEFVEIGHPGVVLSIVEL